MIDWIRDEKPEVSPREAPVPFTIALLEDDAALAHLITRTLQRLGYEVIHFATIASARHGLVKAEWDLLLCDRNLPDGDGIELCAELKNDERSLSRYVMIMTGQDSEEAKLEGFDRGADDYITKPASLPELLACVRAGLRIVELQKALIDSNRRLEHLSSTDSLTGLMNRRAFNTALNKAYEHAKRYERPLALLMLDIDHFKRINDGHGHQTGDDVLEVVGRVIRESTRTSDLTARFGGEEFAVILPETHLMQAVQVAEKIRGAVAAAAVGTPGTPLTVTTSAGVASMPHSQFSDVRGLLAAADKALYRAKNRGRNVVEIERRAEPARITAKGARIEVGAFA